MMLSQLLFILTLGISYTLGALPQFSWDTLPVFFHSANATGFYSRESLHTIAKYAMVTIEKGMGLYITNMDDEDAIAVTMKAVKNANPNVATYFYMNSYKDLRAMSRMAREFNQHPDFGLRTEDGKLVKNKHGLYMFDVSNPKVRKWWLDTCLNATKFANGDGCYCDSSQHVNSTGRLEPSPSPAKMKAWGEGLLTLTKDVQNTLGDDKLLIGKVPTQPYVKAVQLEKFHANNDSINDLILGITNGHVMQAHVPIEVSCKGDITDYLATFLIGIGERSYFGCGNWISEDDDTTPLLWRPEYDKPLGKPTTPPTYRLDTGIWTREFGSGTKVTFDTNKNKGTIEWGQK